jgi:hypothetical protein
MHYYQKACLLIGLVLIRAIWERTLLPMEASLGKRQFLIFSGSSGEMLRPRLFVKMQRQLEVWCRIIGMSPTKVGPEQWSAGKLYEIEKRALKYCKT